MTCTANIQVCNPCVQDPEDLISIIISKKDILKHNPEITFGLAKIT